MIGRVLWGIAWEPQLFLAFFTSVDLTRQFTSRRHDLTRQFSGGSPGNPTEMTAFFRSLFLAFFTSRRHDLTRQFSGGSPGNPSGSSPFSPPSTPPGRPPPDDTPSPSVPLRERRGAHQHGAHLSRSDEPT